MVKAINVYIKYRCFVALIWSFKTLNAILGYFIYINKSVSRALYMIRAYLISVESST